MKPNDQQTESSIDSPTPRIPTLDAFPAGKNHDDLLLCGADNDTEWIPSDSHVDLMEEQ